MNIKKIVTGSAIGFGSVLATAVAVFAAPLVVKPADLTVPVSPFATQSSWYFYDDTANSASITEIPGSYEFVTGIGNPPSGDGSIKFTVPAGGRWNIATNQFAGISLTGLGALDFTIYRPSSSAGTTDTTLFFNLDVDFDNTAIAGYQGRLVYVPADNGVVTENSWQTWDMDSGMWRWSRFASNGNQWLDGETDELRSWSEILTAFPNAEVLFETFTGQVLVRAGHPGPDGLVGYVDSVTISGSTYDFEPDTDSDGIADGLDNCPTDANSNQLNTDNDGQGDVCDTDDDNDGILDGVDNCNVIPNSSQADADNDGIGDACDSQIGPPANKDACKKDGWKVFNNPTFKNQGQCVSFFNHL